VLHGTYSSSFTSVYKYLFPVFWIGGFGWGTLQLLLHPETVVFNRVRGGAPPWAPWLFLALWILGTTMTMWLAWRLVAVRVSDGQLYITRFLTERALTPAWIRAIEELSNWRPRIVRIRFMDETGKDRIVWFMPEWNWPSGELAKPNLVEDLQALVRDSRVSAA
jgi:hypothetical protein